MHPQSIQLGAQTFAEMLGGAGTVSYTHLDVYKRQAQVGSLLRVAEDGSIERTLITGRVLYHETLREAIARNVAKDLGDIALPLLPVGLQPFTVAEFFPTPGLSEYYDPRQHAIALCYVVPIAGDCKPQDETLDVEWVAVSYTHLIPYDCQPYTDVSTNSRGKRKNGRKRRAVSRKYRQLMIVYRVNNQGEIGVQ